MRHHLPSLRASAARASLVASVAWLTALGAACTNSSPNAEGSGGSAATTTAGGGGEGAANTVGTGATNTTTAGGGGAGGEAAWVDPTLTDDPAELTLAAGYEAELWTHLDDLAFQISNQFGAGRLSDAQAQDLTYSSGWGLAVYHSMDEIIELTHVMEATDDESHRLAYGALARETLDVTIPAIAEGRGTEGCAQTSALHLCSPGNFRYLDAGHGVGAAGFVMNAMWENPALRALYADSLNEWATAIVPILERHIAWTESTEPLTFPHMPAKISAGFLAAGKILDEPRYLTAFENVMHILAASAETNTPAGWIGSDVSHARVTMAVAHLAFREQLRGTFPTILTNAQLHDIGDVFEAARDARPFPECFTGSQVGHHGTIVRFSHVFANIVDPAYSLDSVQPGNHTWGCVGETVGALSIGHATALSVDDARH
jgi:hypothetical protein